jgi:hypothetical protein
VTADQQPRTAAQQKYDQWDELFNRCGREDEGRFAGFVGESAMQRAEEVATDLAALRGTVAAHKREESENASDLRLLIADLYGRIQALESPASAPEFDPLWNIKLNVPGWHKDELLAPEPDPLCDLCDGVGWYWNTTHGKNLKCGYCSGTGRISKPAQAEPATAHQEPPDAVLVAIQTLYLLVDRDVTDPLMTYMAQEWRARTGMEFASVVDVDAAIRAYGRDGAR